MFNLQDLVSQAHELEDFFSEISSNISAGEDYEHAKQAVNNIVGHIGKLRDSLESTIVSVSEITNRDFGKAKETGEGIKLDISLGQIHRILKHHENTLSPEIQVEIHKLMEIPATRLFDRFPKMIETLAERLKKTVRFETSGETISVPAELVNLLNDPLVHLVRNAMDHGIEPPQDREEVGKNPEAKLTMGFAKSDTEYTLIIQDDGRGIDKEKVFQKAVQKGLLVADTTQNELRSEQILSLLFHPGFSTKDETSTVSGRGVGMDIVKKCVEDNLGGTIAVFTKEGEGTKFVIKFPIP